MHARVCFVAQHVVHTSSKGRSKSERVVKDNVIHRYSKMTDAVGLSKREEAQQGIPKRKRIHNSIIIILGCGRSERQ